jgi:hypothetical protein
MKTLLMPAQPEQAENRNLAKANFLKKYLPNYDANVVGAFLDNLATEQVAKLQVGAFGSIAFDVIFSPGIIPKMREPQFREAYQEFFRTFYNLETFDEKGWFIYPEEEKFHSDQRVGPNHPFFIRDWVANLRVVALMLRDIRHDSNVFSTVTNNVVESALCRMAENGEPWPDSLLNSLPITMQIRLDTIREQVKQGRVLAPGQFFRIANETEFQERQFMRGNTNTRITQVMEAIDQTSAEERFSRLPPDPATFQFNTKMDWTNPTPRQVRQSNLAPIMPTLDHAEKWVEMFLGVQRNHLRT